MRSSFTTYYRFSHSQESRAASPFLGKRNIFILNITAFLLLPLVPLLSTLPCHMEYPSSWSVKPAVSAVSPPNPLSIPSQLRWSGVKSRKGLGSVSELLCNIQSTPELLTLFPAQIQLIAPY